MSWKSLLIAVVVWVPLGTAGAEEDRPRELLWELQIYGEKHPYVPGVVQDSISVTLEVLLWCDDSRQDTGGITFKKKEPGLSLFVFPGECEAEFAVVKPPRSAVVVNMEGEGSSVLVQQGSPYRYQRSVQWSNKKKREPRRFSLTLVSP